MCSIHSSESILRRGSRLYCGMVAAAMLFATQIIAAQHPPGAAGSPASATGKKSTHHRAQPDPTPPPQEQPAPDPPQPETPQWPVNETPVKPSVTWDSQGLRIQANNSSLHDILNEVSTDTGAKVEGMGTDERVFGEYGPGAARDVIAQLLHGSNYNVLMIGDQGEGTPRQIVLSARRTGSPANANRPNPDQPQDEDYVPDEPQADDQPVQPPVMTGRPPMPMVPQGPPGTPRTPQQVLQELQQRQQQMQDQQQQQQQQQPPHQE